MTSLMRDPIEITPPGQKLFVVFIATFATMSVYESVSPFVITTVPDWRSNLLTIVFTSVVAVIIAFFPLSSFHRQYERSLAEMEKRTALERELRQNEIKFREMFNHANDAVLIHEISPAGPGRFIEVNDQACRMLGYTREELLRLRVQDIDAPEQQENVSAIKEKLFREKNLIFRAEHLTKDRRRIPVEVSNRLIELDGQTVVMSIVRDIAECRSAEEALRESEIKFRGIFDAANDGIQFHDVLEDGSPGQFIDVNDVACRMVGYTRNEMLTMSPLEITTGYHNRPLPEILRELSQGHATFETEHRRKDGTTVPVEINAHTILYQGKKRVISIVRDITERKRTQDALLLSNRKLNLLSSITRHDIRNQITALQAYIELSKESVTDPVELARIGHEFRIAEKIRSQIEFTADYENLGVTSPVWQEICGIVTTAVAALPMGGVRLDIRQDGLEVFGDPLLEKVFYNLIDNALRYGGERLTTLRIASRENDGGLVISFHDDGMGIPDADKDLLFTKGFGKNTGLGLFLSREILSITGITITENGVPGTGARFEITVPKGAYRFSGKTDA